MFVQNAQSFAVSPMLRTAAVRLRRNVLKSALQAVGPSSPSNMAGGGSEAFAGPAIVSGHYRALALPVL